MGVETTSVQFSRFFFLASLVWNRPIIKLELALDFEMPCCEVGFKSNTCQASEESDAVQKMKGHGEGSG